MILHEHAEVFSRAVSHTQLSNDKGSVLICLMLSSKGDASLEYEYSHIKLQTFFFLSLKARRWLLAPRMASGPSRRTRVPIPSTSGTVVVGIPVLGKW